MSHANQITESATAPHAAATPGAAAGTAAAPLEKFSLGITIMAFSVFLLGLVWGTTIVKLRSEREAEIAGITRHTANLARAVEEHAARTIREVDQVLLFVQHQYNNNTQRTKPDLRNLIEDGQIFSRIYTDLSIIDERGHLAADSQPFKPANLSDHEHFQVHVAPDILFQPFISKPVVGHASGRPSIQISRRINKPDSTFGGVAVASIDPAYFPGFYREVDLGHQGFITIVGLDGIVRARRTGNDTTVGQDLSKAPLFRHLKAGPTGSYESMSPLDGKPHLISYRLLRDYPLVAVVGVGTEEAMAGYDQRAGNYYAAAALVSAAIAVFTALLLAMVARQRRTEEALRLRNIELGRTAMANARLAAIVEDSNDAIVSRDMDFRILSWNAAAERLFGYAATEVLGRSIDFLIPPDEWAAATHGRAALARGERVSGRSAVRLARDGRRIDVSLTQSPINDENGRMVGASLVFRDISGRKRAEAERRQAEARYRTTFDSAPIGILNVDLERTILDVNPTLCGILGYRREELVNQPLDVIVHPAYRGTDYQKYAGKMLSDDLATFSSERKYLRRDGSSIWVNRTISLVRDAGGQPLYFVRLIEDISARKQAEEALRSSEQRFRAMFDHAGAGITMRPAHARNLHWLEVNDQFCRMLGYGREELLRLSTADITPPEEQPAADRDTERLLRGEITSYTREKRIVRKDGSLIWVMVTVAALPDGAGGIGNIISVYHDISGRKTADAERAQLAAIVESSSDAIVSRDLDDTILTWNPAAERLFGWSAAEAIGRPASIIVPPDIRRRYLRNRRAANDGRHVPAYDTVRLARDGRQIDVSVTPSPIRDPNGRVVAVSLIFRDIAEQKRAEARIHQLNAELEQRVRERTLELEFANRELESFSYSVSHDLRAPARRIEGFSDLLMRSHGTSLGEQAGALVARIRGGARQMGRMIDDLLKLARTNHQPPVKVEVDISEIAREVLADLRAAEPERAVEAIVAPGLIAVADRGLMRVAMENLIGNAWKFTGKVGAARIEVGVRQAGTEHAYFVRDNGAGFDMNYAGRLFGAFQRLHATDEFEGTGVGLATVHRIVARHGGRIWAESEPGRGAVFSFTLPAGAAAPDAVRQAGPAAASGALQQPQ